MCMLQFPVPPGGVPELSRYALQTSLSSSVEVCKAKRFSWFSLGILFIYCFAIAYDIAYDIPLQLHMIYSVGLDLPVPSPRAPLGGARGLVTVTYTVQFDPQDIISR